MSDRQISPDNGHAAIQVPLWEAIDSLTAEVERIDDAYLLLQSTVDFARSTLSTVLAGQQALAALKTELEASLIRERTAQSCIDALEERVAALEPKPAPVPDSDPVPDGDGAPADLS